MKKGSSSLNKNINKIMIFLFICFLLISPQAYAHDDTLLQQQIWSLQNKVNDLEWERSQQRFYNNLEALIWLKQLQTERYNKEAAVIQKEMDEQIATKKGPYYITVLKATKYLDDNYCRQYYDQKGNLVTKRSKVPRLCRPEVFDEYIDEQFRLAQEKEARDKEIQRQIAAKQGPYYDVQLKVKKIWDENDCWRHYDKDRKLISEESVLPKVCRFEFVEKQLEAARK